MQIVNNKITLMKGETATYDSKLKNYADGSPYVLLDDELSYYAVFTVKSSAQGYGDYVFRHSIDMSGTHRFDSKTWVSYSSSTFDDGVPPTTGNENMLHRNTSGDYAYYNYTTSAWVEYEFTISFDFSYSDTSTIENKKYLYELVLFGGTPKAEPEVGDDLPIDITFKMPIVYPIDFFIGGSLSD